MKSIQEYHNQFSGTVEEDDFKRIALYLEHYTEELVRIYQVNAGKDEITEATENLYRIMLYQLDSISEELDSEPQSVVADILEDLEAGDNRAAGNIRALIGKAGTEKETRHPVLTVLAKRIVDRQKSESNLNGSFTS